MRLFLGLLISLQLVLSLQASGPGINRAETGARAGDKPFTAWVRPVNISQSPAPVPQATWPALALDESGQLIYLAWSERRSAVQDIYYTMSVNGGESWAATRPAKQTQNNSLRPSLAVGSGAAFIVWAEETEQAHALYQWASATGALVTVPNERPQLASASQLARSSDGALHLVLQGGLPGEQPDILYSRRTAAATAWPATTAVFTHTASGSHNPAIAVTPDGKQVHLVWQENRSASASDIYYLRGDWQGAAMSWGTPRSISTGITRSVRPTIVLETGPGTGTIVHVAWGEQANGYAEQYVRYSRSNDGGTSWSASVRIDAAAVSANNVAPTDTAPALDVTPDGAVCAAWHGFRPGAPVEAEEIYVACLPGGTNIWGIPANISSSPHLVSIRPVLKIGQDGILHVVWQELAGNDPKSEYEIFYTHSIPYAVMLPITRR